MQLRSWISYSLYSGWWLSTMKASFLLITWSHATFIKFCNSIFEPFGIYAEIRQLSRSLSNDCKISWKSFENWLSLIFVLSALDAVTCDLSFSSWPCGVWPLYLDLVSFFSAPDLVTCDLYIFSAIDLVVCDPFTLTLSFKLCFFSALDLVVCDPLYFDLDLWSLFF